MIDAAQIRRVSDEIARRFQPERITLFGSYAYGIPTAGVVSSPIACRKCLVLAAGVLYTHGPPALVSFGLDVIQCLP